MLGLMTDEFADVLLSPVSDTKPAGVYLKSERELYRPLRNLFNIAQTSLHKLSQNPAPSELDDLILENQENWQTLEALLMDILLNNSRDLECMAWLAMAQIFSADPYPHLVHVLRLMDQMMQTFWPEVHPYLPDEKLRMSDVDGIAKERAELQARPLKWLFGESDSSCQMAVPLRMMPLVYVRDKNLNSMAKSS